MREKRIKRKEGGWKEGRDPQWTSRGRAVHTGKGGGFGLGDVCCDSRCSLLTTAHASPTATRDVQGELEGDTIGD